MSFVQLVTNVNLAICQRERLLKRLCERSLIVKNQLRYIHRRQISCRNFCPVLLNWACRNPWILWRNNHIYMYGMDFSVTEISATKSALTIFLPFRIDVENRRISFRSKGFKVENSGRLRWAEQHHIAVIITDLYKLACKYIALLILYWSCLY